MTPRRLSEIQIQLVWINEYDVVEVDQVFPFRGDKAGTALEKAQEFLSVLPGLPAAPAAGAEEQPNQGAASGGAAQARPAAQDLGEPAP